MISKRLLEHIGFKLVNKSDTSESWCFEDGFWVDYGDSVKGGPFLSKSINGDLHTETEFFKKFIKHIRSDMKERAWICFNEVENI